MSDVKAFAVTEHMECTGAIIFAKHSIVARRLGANEYADGELSGVSCHRAPWADSCAETGIVPASLCVEHGWHFECTGCGRRIDTDLGYDEDEERYRGWKPEHVTGHQHSAVFCDKHCEEAHEAREAERKRRQARAIERFTNIVRRRFPNCEIVDDGYSRPHAFVTKHNGRWVTEQIIVSFNFPGMKYGPASLRWDRHYGRRREKPHYTCCNGDREAFEAYVAHPSPES